MNEEIKKSFEALGIHVEDAAPRAIEPNVIEKSVTDLNGNKRSVMIIEDNEEIWKSEVLEEHEYELEKGAIGNALNRIGEDGLEGKPFIVKTGKEIKSGLSAIVPLLTTEMAESTRVMGVLKAQIGLDPDADYDEYDTEGLSARIPDVPKRYSYEVMYPNESGKASDIAIPIVGEAKQEESVRKAMRAYNDSSRKVLKGKIELMKINTVLNNLGDGKSYRLSIHEATMLGF